MALLHRFVAARRENRSLCHQLIMGQGKTTVIAPLLAIMLADRAHLVISVVPMPLLPSARAVLRVRVRALLEQPSRDGKRRSREPAISSEPAASACGRTAGGCERRQGRELRAASCAARRRRQPRPPRLRKYASSPQ